MKTLWTPPTEVKVGKGGRAVSVMVQLPTKWRLVHDNGNNHGDLFATPQPPKPYLIFVRTIRIPSDSPGRLPSDRDAGIVK
jgi:hypothetical protein